MNFEIIGEMTDIEEISSGRGIRELARLRKLYGKEKWRKLKGQAMVCLESGSVRLAELHWYEVHDIGRKEIKHKCYLD
ncbi:MAG: hypothetical protein KME30_16820 [Iphinoe sp. HA4291-MV1]|jgi:hypothetical protein|nr:hypothetical protein [Iphinoe sp. HA4291-MV1]